jgi:hypothetical protein
MSIGPDIKEVLQEVGTKVTILPAAVGDTGEYVQVILNKQVTKPFIREFFVEAVLAYDTSIDAGDRLSMTDGMIYLVMNKTPVTLEDEIYQYSSVFYKTNTIGRILRPSVSTRDARYRQGPGWTIFKTGCYALMTEYLYGNELEVDEEIANLGLKREELYISASDLISQDDRFDVSEIGTVSKNSEDGTITAGAAIALGFSPISETWTITFDSPTSFSVSGSDVGAVDVAGVVGTALAVEDFFTIPSNFFAGTWAEGDTCSFVTTAEYYWVQDVKKRRYNNVWVAMLAEDTR